MKFSKWQGCGNDFVLVDCFKENVSDFAAFAKKVCDRHYGIGGDGVLYVLPSDKADFRMRIFNTDGSEAEMCGNGIRCFARYLHDFGLTEKEEFTVETGAGILVPRLQIEAGKVTGVRVDMGEPVLDGEKIPVTGFGMNRVIEEDIEVKGKNYKMTCVSMGNPHCVIFVEDAEAFPIYELGASFESHPAFPRKTNTEFVEVRDRQHARLGARRCRDARLRHGLVRDGRRRCADGPHGPQGRGRARRRQAHGRVGRGDEPRLYDGAGGARLHGRDCGLMGAAL